MKILAQQSFDEMDFTLSRYERLCRAILRAGYQVYTVESCLESNASLPAVVLRHDVDRRPTNAVRMAQLENRLGIRSTFYVRMVSTVFNPKLVTALYDLGHEVGYHYEVLAKARGDMNRAVELLTRELNELRKWVPITTAAMHGSPLSRWNNLSIWNQLQLADFGLKGEAYLSFDCEQFAYYTDTGRTWNANHTNLRDRTKNMARFPRVRTTGELEATISRISVGAIYIQTHPERWNDSLAAWMRSMMADCGANLAKTGLNASGFLR